MRELLEEFYDVTDIEDMLYQFIRLYILDFINKLDGLVDWSATSTQDAILQFIKNEINFSDLRTAFIVEHMEFFQEQELRFILKVSRCEMWKAIIFDNYSQLREHMQIQVKRIMDLHDLNVVLNLGNRKGA